MNGWSLERQPGGTWLLRGGERCLRVPPAAVVVGRGGDPVLSAAVRRALAGMPPSHRSRLRWRWIWLHVTVVPAAPVRRAARILAPATQGRFLAAAGLLGLAAAVAQQWWWPHPERGFTWATAMGILLAALVHELGHAAALWRGGYFPGGIGLGMMGILPVLTCDVSCVNLLPRRARLRVDLAGPAWQALVAGLLALAGGWSRRGDLLLASAGAWLGVAWSLVPWGRSDGYWALRDLLAGEGGPEDAGRARRILRRLLDGLVLVPALAGLVWLVRRLAAALFSA